MAIYFAPATGGFLLWVYDRLRPPVRYGLLPGVLDATVLLLCGLRMTAPLVPPSGHMLLFVYAAMTAKSGPVRWIMAGLVAETSYIKLAVWGDYWSWGWGMFAGFVLALLFRTSMRTSTGVLWDDSATANRAICPSKD